MEAAQRECLVTKLAQLWTRDANGQQPEAGECARMVLQPKQQPAIICCS